MGGMGGEEFSPVIREEKAKRNQYNTLKKSERARAGVLSVRCVQVIRASEIKRGATSNQQFTIGPIVQASLFPQLHDSKNRLVGLQTNL